jgi:hypothetical protein
VAARMALSLLAPLLLIRLLGAARPRRGDLLLRVIGLRDHGLVHRPILEPEDEEEAAAEPARDYRG